jgi:hypothetical protein
MYVQAVMSGQGLSGVTAALVAAAASFTASSTAGDDGCNAPADDADDGNGNCDTYDNVDYGSFTYFLVACLIFLVCIVSYIALETTPFAKYYNQASTAGARKVAITDDAYSVSPIAEDSGDAYSPHHGDIGVGDKRNAPLSGVDEESGVRPPPALADYTRVVGLVRREAFSVWFVFTVTIALFPALSAEIEPSPTSDCGGPGVFTKSTFTATMFVVFNWFDLVGRSAAGFAQVRLSSYLQTALLLQCLKSLFALRISLGSVHFERVAADGVRRAGGLLSALRGVQRERQPARGRLRELVVGPAHHDVHGAVQRLRVDLVHDLRAAARGVRPRFGNRGLDNDPSPHLRPLFGVHAELLRCVCGAWVRALRALSLPSLALAFFSRTPF